MIWLWWIGSGPEDASMLEQVRARVEQAYRGPAALVRDAERPADAYDPVRGQHSSGKVLKFLGERAGALGAPAGTRVLGLTDQDLFIPVLTFVYGEAQLDGPSAVVSTARLRGDRLPWQPAVPLLERVTKEALHELGHAFGLLHCPDAACVMSRSVNLAGVDAKRAALCEDCRLRLQELRARRRTA